MMKNYRSKDRYKSFCKEWSKLKNAAQRGREPWVTMMMTRLCRKTERPRSSALLGGFCTFHLQSCMHLQASYTDIYITNT